ncbi:MAG: hypothetical protein ACI97A_004479 [Planctomycetota bacterium]|jgi:hypothetical protein
MIIVASWESDDVGLDWIWGRNRNWFGIVFLLIAIWYLGLSSLEWRFPVYLGGFSMFTYAACFIFLRSVPDFWGNVTPAKGAQLGGICETAKTLSFIGLLIADLATLATLVNES